MIASQDIIEPLITSAIGFAIQGSSVSLFGLYLLTRNRPLIMRGNYALIQLMPSFVFILGTGVLAISVSPLASLLYYSLLLLASGVSAFIHARFSRTIVLVGVEKKLIGDMFPVTQGASVAQMELSKWMGGSQFLIEFNHEKWNVTTIQRTGIMTVSPDQPVHNSRLKALIPELRSLNKNRFTSKGAMIYIAYGIFAFAIAAGEILLNRFLFT